jgi:hypothetical protein
MEKQKSSIEWLISELKRRILIIESEPDGIVRTTMIDNFLVDVDEAKEMHKQEIMNAYKFGISDEYVIGSQQYYNETFGK